MLTSRLWSVAVDEPIRSHLPNENYRRGWDETFGKSKVQRIGSDGDWNGGTWVERDPLDEAVRQSNLTIRHG